MSLFESESKVMTIKDTTGRVEYSIQKNAKKNRYIDINLTALELQELNKNPDGLGFIIKLKDNSCLFISIKYDSIGLNNKATGNAT